VACEPEFDQVESASTVDVRCDRNGRGRTVKAGKSAPAIASHGKACPAYPCRGELVQTQAGELGWGHAQAGELGREHENQRGHHSAYRLAYQVCLMGVALAAVVWAVDPCGGCREFLTEYRVDRGCHRYCSSPVGNLKNGGCQRHWVAGDVGLDIRIHSAEDHQAG
jgi:hypothetical protein